MEQLSNLSEIKESLPGDVLKQLRNVSIFNMRDKDHFPDENSCIVFAQGFGLIPTTDSEILHCKGNFCRVVMNKSTKVGFRFICRNKKPYKKERCLAEISPLQNTLFEESRITMPDIFKLVMCFVSRLTMTQVMEQLSFGKETVIGWYGSCREVCKVVLANEYQRMIHLGGVEVDESHLFLWKYDFGRKRKSNDDISSDNEARNDNYLAESEYRRRYFHNMNMEPLPLEDRFLMFWYHIKLVFPGPGKVGLMYPNAASIDPDYVDGDRSHEVNGYSRHKVNDDSSYEVTDSGSMDAAFDYAYEETVEELPSKRKKTNPLFHL